MASLDAHCVVVQEEDFSVLLLLSVVFESHWYLVCTALLLQSVEYVLLVLFPT